MFSGPFEKFIYITEKSMNTLRFYKGNGVVSFTSYKSVVYHHMCHYGNT